MSSQVSIIPYNPELRPFFKSINEEWIVDMFKMEDADRKVLEDPEKYILDKGGIILFATHPERGVIGTCALQPTGPGEYELTKMGVLQKARGLQAGNVLLHAAIQKARDLEARRLYLMTNKKCEAAIHLYEKFGFEHSEEILRTLGVKYERCDVAMEYPLHK